MFQLIRGHVSPSPSPLSYWICVCDRAQKSWYGDEDKIKLLELTMTTLLLVQ